MLFRQSVWDTFDIGSLKNLILLFSRSLDVGLSKPLGERECRAIEGE